MGTALDAAAAGDIDARATVFAALGQRASTGAAGATTTELRAVMRFEPREDLRVLERAGWDT